MNSELAALLNKLKDEKERQKNNYLISLGLIDKTKCNKKRIFSNEFDEGWSYDNRNDRYYKDIDEPVAIEISDEEYQELLKYSDIIEAAKDKEGNNASTKYANIIRIVASSLFVINIVVAVVLCTILSNSHTAKDFTWLPAVVALLYCILFYPMLIGFSKIVAVAERKLQE